MADPSVSSVVSAGPGVERNTTSGFIFKRYPAQVKDMSLDIHTHDPIITMTG